MRRTKDFADAIRAKLAANPDLAKLVEDELFNADLASKVYAARKAAGLTQKELAERAHTQQSVISRIEDADYEGRSLTLLSKIAKALDLQLRVELCERCVSQSERISQTYFVEWPEAWQEPRHLEPWQESTPWDEYEGNVIIDSSRGFQGKWTFTEGINWIMQNSGSPLIAR
jgi:transcriptional regulator with XRE-family HTH domain